MKITCDSCGAYFDIDNHNTCPYCGAAFDNDKELQDEKQRDNRLRDINVENQEVDLELKKADLKSKQLENESKQVSKNIQSSIEGVAKTGNTIAKFIKVIIVTIGLLLAGVFIVNTVTGSTVAELIEKNKEEKESGKGDVLEDKVVVGFNESAQLSKYKVTITEIKEEISEVQWAPGEGNKYIGFKFVVENTCEQTINMKGTNVYCIVDGEMMPIFNQSTFETPKSGNILPGIKNSGWFVYEVPENTKEFEIRFGQYITFKFQNPLLEENIEE